jgi:Chitobiase/beta-hexosaminidase C-terminal domain/Bacterial Ig-like domain (group 2)
MHKILLFVLLNMTVPAFAATYTVAAGSSVATIQAIVNTAGSAPGSTVAFSAGTYSLAATLTLPCSNGTIYTGPNVGIVTQSRLPTAVLTSTVPTNYALSTDSNVSSLTGGEGCTIQYLRFTGTQGGILVYNPASGIVIQENAFDNNNPPAGGASSQSNIYLDGQNAGFSAATGLQHISVVWNTFFANCAAIRAVAWPDSGGGCAATWVEGYNNYLTWSNNTVDLTEEGLKLSEQSSLGISSLNTDVENNNLQGNSRIMIESQQDTNGSAVYSHNSFYQPDNPSYNTFELSIPEYTPSVSPTHTASDNVFIANVPVTISGSGAHYGIGLELWGAGSIATNNLFQGGNGGDTCVAGWGCSGWGLVVGEPFTNATITGNYFSGTDVWAGTVNNVGNAVGYEDNASSSNAGLILSDNTVVQTSTTIPTVAPAISAASSSGQYIVTITDADKKHGLSIFYTTDGTTPATFGPGGSAGTSRLYSAPFTVPGGTTAKAVASWGQGANQGVAFPSFGYVPSAIVSEVVGASGRTVVSAYLGQKANANTMTTGSTLQFTAYAVYSDGSAGLLPDEEGNAVTGWNTSNHSVAKVSSGGHVTAMAAGGVQVQATVGSVKSSPWVVTVSSPAAPATAAARVADVQPSTVSQAPAVSEAPAVSAASTVSEASAVSAAQGAPVASGLGPIPAAPGAALPDSFVGPFWQLVTPVGGSASISNSHLFLGVPGGGNHDPLFPSNQAVRVVQAIGNQDFDVAIKIDSPLVASDGDTSQGLMLLTDNENFITFALVTDGNHIGLSAHTVRNGVATMVLEDTDFNQYQNPMYLRLAKAGSACVAYYSVDGVNWTQAVNFTDGMAPTALGPFASNYSKTPGNALPVVMSVNWFDVLQQ